MSLDAHVGQFGTGTGTSNIAVTGVGFQPTLVLFWHSGLAAAGSGAGARHGFGAASSSTARWVATYNSTDGSASSQINSYGSNAACVLLWDPGSGAVEGALDLVSLDADGFTVVPDTAFPADVQINYMALGGTDLLDVAVGSETVPLFATSHSVTGLGFQPDFYMLGTAGGHSWPAAGGIPSMSVGWTDGTAEACTSIGGDHLADPSNTASMVSTGHIVTSHGGASGSAPSNEFGHTSMDADGFTINVDIGNARLDIGYVAIRATNIAVGTQALQTSTGTFGLGSLGFAPASLVMMATPGATADEATPSAGGSRVLGGASAADARGSAAVYDEDAVATMDTEQRHAADKVLSYFRDRTDHTLLGEVDVSSFDADTVTLNQTTADGVATLAPWFALGPAAGGTNDGAVTLGALTTSATGSVPRAGDGAVTLGAVTASGTGTAGQARTGDGAVTLGALTTSAAGSIPETGDGAVTLGALTTSGAGVVPVQGAGALTLGAATVSATGLVPRTGDGSVTLGALTVFGLESPRESPTGKSSLQFGINIGL